MEYLQSESFRDLIENTVITCLLINAFYDSWRIYRLEGKLERHMKSLKTIQGRCWKNHG